MSELSQESTDNLPEMEEAIYPSAHLASSSTNMNTDNNTNTSMESPPSSVPPFLVENKDPTELTNQYNERKISLSSGSGSISFSSSSVSEPPSTSEMIDKLRTIKPFNERQLLTFYQNQFLDNNQQFIDNFVQTHKISDLNRYYEALVKLERSTERFDTIERTIQDLIVSVREVELSAWKLSTKQITKAEQCGDGQRLEETVSYQFAEYDQNAVRELEDRYYPITRERILNEQMVCHYYQRANQLKFELDLYRKLQWIKSQPRQLGILADKLSRQDSMDFHGEEDLDSEQETDNIRLEAHREDFHLLITALFVYFRRQSRQIKCVNFQFKQSLLLLCHKYLTIASLEDRLFIVNHILRCQSGSSVILSNLIDCPDPLPYRSTNYPYGKQLVDFCVTVISTILSPIKDGFIVESDSKSSSPSKINKKHIKTDKKDSFEKIETSKSSPTDSVKSDKWLLVDDEFGDEEISLGSTEIAEIDLISYLNRVPFENCLKFMGLGDDAQCEISSIETGMMKLFAFNTRLIQILRFGLENFHCLRFKELTLFLSSMIKQIIRHSSLNWMFCKEKFTSKDQALLLRLQVEFDNFMLRSITALLSTNRRGVWPLLAQVEFHGITEQMLWHILWVVYNNGLDKKENVGGLCPYMSANYWKDMFARHHQWKFVFLEKISEFSIEEAAAFMDFLFNMAMSRSENGDSDFIQEIVRRISEICLLKKCVSLTNSSKSHGKSSEDSEKELDKNLVKNPPKSLVDNTGYSASRTIKNQDLFILKGTVCLISLLNHFKSMISFLMQFLDEQSSDNELVENPLVELFQSLNLKDFVPEERFYQIANKWIIERKFDDLLNRLGRIALTKVQWNRIAFNSNSTTCLLIEEKFQRLQAFKLFLASQRAIEDNMETFKKGFKPKEKITVAEIVKRFGLKICDSEGSFMPLKDLANSDKLEDFFGWISRTLMILRIHPLSFVPDEAFLDEILFQNKGTTRRLEQSSHVNFKHRIFANLPKPSSSSSSVSSTDSSFTNSELGLLFHDLTLESDKQNPYAYYITCLMSEWVVKSDSKNILENIHAMFKGQSQMLLHFVSNFTLMNINEKTSQDSTLTLMIVEILQNGLQKELTSVILSQLRRFRVLENAFAVSLYWTELLLSVMQFSLTNFNKSSWLSSMNPTTYLMPMIKSSSNASNSSDSGFSGLELLLCDICNIMDSLAEAIIFHDGKLIDLYVTHYSCHRKGFFGAYRDMKLGQILEHPPNRNNLENFNNKNKNQWNILGTLLPWGSKEEICREVFLLTDKSCLASEYLNPFMVLLRQSVNKKLCDKSALNFTFGLKKIESELTSADLPLYLVHICHEIHLRRFRDIWSLLVYELTMKHGEDALEKAIKDSCTSAEISVLPLQLLPLNCLIVFLLNSFPHLEQIDVEAAKSTHPLLPALWRSFYQLYFSYSEGSSSVGMKLINEQIRNQLTLRLNLLFDQHNERWRQLNRMKNDGKKFTSSRLSKVMSMMSVEERLFKFFKSCKLWLNDSKLHNSYVHFDDNPEYRSSDFQCELFKSFFTNDGAGLRMFFLNYIQKRDSKAVEERESLWFRVLKDDSNENLNQEIQPFVEQPSDDDKEVFDFGLKICEEEEEMEEIEKKIVQYGSVINYFSEVSSLINVDLLADEYLECFTEESHQLPEFSAFLMIIHQLVDCTVEEARLVENQLAKLNQNCQEFTREVLPNLLQETKRIVKKQVSCDKEEFDAFGCKGKAKFMFEYQEWIFNEFLREKKERLVNEHLTIIKVLTKELPVQKVVASIYFLEKVLKYINRYFDGTFMDDGRRNLLKQLFQSMSGWIQLLNSVYSVKYIITAQILDLFLELLSSLSDRFSDHVNLFILQTALQRNVNSSLIQQLAPFLNPAKFQDPRMFIEMYKLVGNSLQETSQQTVFVLLSKFDLTGWLNNVQDESLRSEFILCHLNCLQSFGMSPGEEFMVTFDLYRKHLQDLLLINFPAYLPMIVDNIFDGMVKFKIAPKLWNSILHTFGFYTKSLSFADSERSGKITGRSLTDFDFGVFETDLISYVYRQTIFNSHDLFNLCQLLISMHSKLEAASGTQEVLDHYKVYVGKYIQFLGFISFCWIQTNSSRAPDDIQIIWSPLFEMWKPWIFVKTSTKFVAIEHMTFVWQMWTEVFKYSCSLLGRFQDRLLSLFWQEFLGFILAKERQDLDVKDVEMFEEKLMAIENWNKFNPSLKDIELMYEAIIQEKHSMNRFVAFVISKIQWAPTFGNQRLTYEQLAQIIDNLSCVLICLSDEPNILKLDLNSIPFGVLNPENVKQLCFMIIPTIKSKMNVLKSTKEQTSFFKNSELEDSFDLSLLYAICNLNPSQNQYFQTSCNIPHTYFQNSWIISKMAYYTNCVSAILSHFCNVNQVLLSEKNNSNALGQVRNLLKIWCENVKPVLVALNGEDQILLFNTLLNCLPQAQSEELQSKLTPIFVSVMSYAFVQADVIGSLIIATNRTITSKTSLIYLLEAFVELFLDLNGELVFLIHNLHFNGNHLTEELLVEIKERKAYLLSLIFVYSRLCNSTVPEKCTLDYVYSYFQHETQVKPTKESVDSQDEAKLLLFLTKITSLLTRSSTNDSILPKLRDSHIALSFVPKDFGQYVKNSQLLHGEYGLKCLETLLSVCRNMDEFVTEALSRSWFFFKSAPKFSNWCLFSIQLLVLHAVCTALEIFYPNDALVEYETLFVKASAPVGERKVLLLPELEDNNRFRMELFASLRSCHQRLFDTWRKDKAFADVWHTVDAILIMFNGRLQRIVRNSKIDSDSNPNNVAFNVAEHLAIFQAERFALIHGNLTNKLTDKNFVKSYL